jgi:hypothetical protein
LLFGVRLEDRAGGVRVADGGGRADAEDGGEVERVGPAVESFVEPAVYCYVT